MGIRNLIKYCSFTFLVFGCNITQRKHLIVNTKFQQVSVKYEVFDSLEQLLCQKIKALGNDSTGILIEPFGDFRFSEDGMSNSRYIYKIIIYTPQSFYSRNMIYKSDRQMSLCGKLYPVMLLRLDDVFTQIDKNRVWPYNHLSEPFDLYNREGYIVDMSNKKVLVCTYVNK